MSREIEFRGWDGNAMFQVAQITFAEAIWSVDKGRGVSIPYQPHIILMQYTGLKDKNGKKIFEGDLLRLPAGTKWQEENYTAYEVFFHDGDMAMGQGIGYRMCRCYHHGSVAGNHIYPFLPKFASVMIVVGNIHENPELLNERNQ